MKLKVVVEEYTFDINIGQDGLNDFAWLALTAAKLYGKKKYPSGNYLPIILKFYDTIIPHPKTKIINFLKEQKLYQKEGEEDEEVNTENNQIVFTVELQKQNTVMTPKYKDWFNKAFGSSRNQMQVSCDFTQFIQENKKREPYQFIMQFQYSMFKELRNEFKHIEPEKQYQFLMQEEVQQDRIRIYYDLELPYGTITPNPPEIYRRRKNDSEQKLELLTLTYDKDFYSFKVEPQPVSQDETLKIIKNRMAIPPHLSEKLLQQEQEIKKEVNTGSFCPFEFNTLWQLIENNSKSKEIFDEIDQTIKIKMQKILSDNLNKLYEIFFEYSMLYVQNTDKKEEITVSLQDVMHFLKFYLILNDSLNLFQFLEVYDSENIRIESARSTVDNSNGIMFHEFIEIIIRAINFLQAEILMSNEESLDMSLEKAVNQIVTIDASETDLNEFQKHMKYNITLMTFIRENSEILQHVFLEKLQDSSLDNKKFHLLPEQIKSLIIDAGFKGDNLDEIVNTCLSQLINEEKYSGFEGIFYYEFLQVMQWLSLVLITDQEEEEKQNEEEDPEQGVDQLIEKFRFFITQFQQ